MLNLQTIAESLNTKCQGRAWVFVTSQEDMDKVVGDRTKQLGNDFSKIQARFKTRVKLTSADVEEVIRKRLLEKNEAGAAALHAIYAKESANFKTLFDFVDGAKTYRNYTDETHFVGTYPFVSYQFPLFQAAIEGISDHNVFEGRNSSVGERSMLGVVQQVAKDIGDVEVGHLATFDHMFAGIRASLKSAAQRSIDVAERNLDNPLAIRLLKALFLVKYVESFQATPRNLTVLVYDRFGLDLPALSEDVKEALTLLQTQTYIQRNGNVYEYLTNEEQEIEEEIKNLDIDASEVSARLFKILSGDIVKTNKLRYAKNGQDFPFGFKLDDQVHGPQRELSIHFITPEYPFTPDEMRMHSAGKDELRVILEPDERVLSDLRLLIKTEKYTKRKQTTSLSAIEDQILRSKAAQNVDREKELIERIRRAVGEAALIINATDVSSSSQDALARVTDGFQDLVSRTYTQLKLLGGVTYSEQQVAGAANPDSGLFDAEAWTKLSTPGEEVLSFILRKQALGEQVTVKTIVDAFQAKPYGWDLASIEVFVGYLIGASKVTLTVDGNVAQAKRSGRRVAEHPEALSRGRRSAENIRRTQSHRLPEVLHGLLRRCQRAQGSAGAGPLWRRQAQGQARRTQGHRHGLEVPVRRATQRPHQPARTGGGQARRVVPHRLQSWRRPTRRQGLDGDKKAVVIVSDALRYEVADELGSRIRQEDHFDASLDATLGVLPSYTQLGMAALLPHTTLKHSPDAKTVLADDQPTNGTAFRSKILESVGGSAIGAEDFKALSADERRELYRANRVCTLPQSHRCRGKQAGH